MRIWRIDATFAGDEVLCAGEIVEDVAGMLTRFVRSEASLEMLTDRLAAAGWEFDVYEEEIGDLPLDQLERLITCPWPVLATSRLCALAAAPIAAARERLDEILHAKGLPQLKAMPPKPPSPVSKEDPHGSSDT